MPYVRRNAQGEVVSLHRHAEAGTSEFLPDEHADVLSFFGAGTAAGGSGDAEGFARLDADFVRVLEDVIDTLVAKNLINITDLPPEAQAKLFSRKSFRERRSQNSLRLFGDTVGFGNVIDDTQFDTQFGDTL
ncbi:MAG TPA: hypothetical protein VML58_08965 [Burkholderiaceae bacterium]|nr:hypothetical protein [Burkholderiaceae bacterium]